MEKIVVALFVSFLFSITFGQSVYWYSVDLTRVDNDYLKVTLLTPKVAGKKINSHYSGSYPEMPRKNLAIKNT
jgi:hypothetical protein